MTANLFSMVVAFLMSGCCLAQQAAITDGEVFEQPRPVDQVRSKQFGAIGIPASARVTPIYVEAAGSPELTEKLVAIIAALGFQVTADKNAMHSITLKGEVEVFGKEVRMDRPYQRTLASFIEGNREIKFDLGMFERFKFEQHGYVGGICAPMAFMMGEGAAKEAKAKCLMYNQSARIALEYASGGGRQKAAYREESQSNELNLEALVDHVLARLGELIRVQEPVAGAEGVGNGG